MSVEHLAVSLELDKRTEIYKPAKVTRRRSRIVRCSVCGAVIGQCKAFRQDLSAVPVLAGGGQSFVEGGEGDGQEESIKEETSESQETETTAGILDEKETQEKEGSAAAAAAALHDIP